MPRCLLSGKAINKRCKINKKGNSSPECTSSTRSMQINSCPESYLHFCMTVVTVESSLSKKKSSRQVKTKKGLWHTLACWSMICLEALLLWCSKSCMMNKSALQVSGVAQDRYPLTYRIMWSKVKVRIKLNHSTGRSLVLIMMKLHLISRKVTSLQIIWLTLISSDKFKRLSYPQ